MISNYIFKRTDSSKCTGYSPVRNDPLIVSLAKKYKVTPTQVILAWHLSRNTIILPTSKNKERQKENITVRHTIRAPFLFFFCSMTVDIVLDPYVVRRRSRQDLGIGSWAAALSRRRPYHWTAVWVDARTTWVGNLPTKGLVGDINRLSGMCNKYIFRK